MADQDLEIGLGFSGADDGAKELLRLMLGELKAWRAENKAAQAEDRAAAAQRRAQLAAERAERAKAAAERQRTAKAEREAAKAAAAEVRAKAAAERAAAKATQEAAAAARRHAAALRQQGQQASGAEAAIGRLARRAAVLASTLAAGFGVTQFIRAGLGFNQTIESATLGIGSLISAQATLKDQEGQTLKGTEALAAGLELATDQVRQLRIAGLQTAATTQQLVEAFQQAVGAGLSAGLTLDQIRNLTTSIVQAAGALGVPMEQLNQEVRSILDGTIDRNSRVAKALGLTNEQIASAQRAGQLFDFLNGKLVAFQVAGVQTAQTFSGVMSNLAESIQTFAGEVNQPLFEAIKSVASDTITRLFDTTNLKVSKEFEGLVQLGQEIGARLGTLLDKVVNGLLDGAAALGQAFQDNRADVLAFFDALEEVASEVGNIIVSFVEFVGSVVELGLETGALHAIMKALADVLKTVADNIELVVTIIAGFKITGLIAAIAQMTPLGRAATVTALALTTLLAIIERLQGAADREAAATRAQVDARTEDTKQIGRLLKQYRDLATQIDSKKLQGEALEKARARLRDITDQLVKLSPDFQEALKKEGQSATETAEAFARLASKRLNFAEERLATAEAQLNELERQKALLEKDPPRRLVSAKTGATVVDTGPIDKVNEDIRRQVALVKSLEKSYNAASEAVQSVSLPDVSGNTPNKGNKGAANDLKQQLQARERLIKSELEQETAALKRNLDQGLISYAGFYSQLTAIQQKATDDRIANAKKLLAHTTDEGEKSQLQQRIQELEDERAEIARRNNAALLEAQRDLEAKVLGIRAQSLEQQGRLEEAKRLELENQFRDLITRLKGEGRTADLDLIAQIFNVELAKTRSGQILAVMDRAEQRLQGTQRQIELAQQVGAISQREAQEQLAEAYIRTADAIAAQLPALRAAAAEAGPGALDQIDKLKEEELKVAELRAQAILLRDRFREIREDFRQGFGNTFTQFLEDATDKTQHFTDALEGMARGLLSTVRNIANSQLSGTLERALFDPGKVLGPKQAPAAQVTDLASQAAQTAQRTAVAAQEQAAAATLVTGTTLLAASAPVLQAGAATLATGAGILAGSSGGLVLPAGILNVGAGALAAAVPGLQAAASTLLAAAIMLQSVSFFGGVPFASGGPVRGPGTGRSDSIPAWLSNGEFVVNARSTARHRSLLETINRDGQVFRAPKLRSGVPGFNRGGLVADAQAGAAGMAARIMAHIQVGLADGLIEQRTERYLESPRGAAVQVGVVGKHRSATTDALRLRPRRR